jgi:hypothetical protein
VSSTEIWPADIRGIRNQFMQDWRRWTASDQSTAGWTPAYAEAALTASPRFFVARSGKLLATSPSEHGWKHYFRPLLNQMLGT